MDEETRSWLALKRLPGLTAKRWQRLLEQKSELKTCFNKGRFTSGFRQWCISQGFEPQLPDWQGVDADFKWLNQTGNHLITLRDPQYPLLLKNISVPPPLLFVAGRLEILAEPQIAIVGSRRPSVQGKKDAYNFAYDLAKQGLIIASGLALGIDGASHEGALAALGGTVAVLGSSLDIIYPPVHRNLAERIKDTSALVSEFPIGTEPKPNNFVQRNRIISGLSWGVLVVEATLKSGSLITADYALNQGREVFALPGSIHNPLTKGCHQLIRNGAKCVEASEHIMEEFKYRLGERSLFQHQINRMEDRPSTNPLLQHIDEMCTPIDLIVDRTGLTAQEVSLILLELELDGLIASVPGGYIRKVIGGQSDERKCN